MVDAFFPSSTKTQGSSERSEKGGGTRTTEVVHGHVYQESVTG